MAGLDQFEFIRQIGKGSYGEVTLQRHKKDRKQVHLYKHMTTRVRHFAHVQFIQNVQLILYKKREI